LIIYSRIIKNSQPTFEILILQGFQEGSLEQKTAVIRPESLLIDILWKLFDILQ